MIDIRTLRKWRIFISHSSDDKKLLVDPLVTYLQERGTYTWYDKINIPKSKSIYDEVQKGLKGAKGGIVIFSQNFIKDRPEDETEWAKIELSVMAHKRDTENFFIIPVFYDIKPKNLPKTFKTLLDDNNGFPFKGGDNINDLAININNEVKKIQSKERKRELIKL